MRRLLLLIIAAVSLVITIWGWRYTIHLMSVYDDQLSMWVGIGIAFCLVIYFVFLWLFVFWCLKPKHRLNETRD